MAEGAIAKGMLPNLHPLDEGSASRLLQGLVHPDDAPPGYAPVAELLASAAQLPPVDEDAGEATISAMVEVIRTGAGVPDTQRRRPMIGRLLAGKALAAMATVALTATGAAAATGTLPDPVQNVVAGAVSHVGVDLPGKGGKSADHRQDGEHRQDADHGQPGDDTPAGDESGDHGKGETISGITHDPELDGQPKGPTVCKEASNDRCKAGENGQDVGSEDDGAPPATGPGVNKGQGKGADDDHTPPVRPTTGSIDTGAEHSGRDLPSGKGKPDGDS